MAPKPAKESRRDKREKLRAASKIKAGTILKGSIVEVNELFVVVELPEGMIFYAITPLRCLWQIKS